MRRFDPSLAAPSLVLAALMAGGCHQDRDAVLLIVITAAGSPPLVANLEVTVTGAAGPSSQNYARDGGQVIAFPTTLTADLPPRATGTLTIDVAASDANGATVATGHAGPLTVSAGDQPTIYVELACGGGPCGADAGVGTSVDAGGTPIPSPRCGDGRIEPGETCDTAIAAGDPGACPPAGCDDHVACTRDIPSGDGCTAACSHVEITVPIANDGCCPAGATFETDSDCSPTCGDGAVEPGETCDTAIVAGQPGACPSAIDCTDVDPCAVAELVSAGTCSAVCLRTQITAAVFGDGCCPPGANSAVDTDCPGACGDGIRQTGEACDVAIVAPAPGSCPTSCDDGAACMTEFLSGASCQATCIRIPITARISGDGCCPPGATRATDTDCPASCGNGIVEPGEACDPAASGPGACPDACPPPLSPCLQVALTGDADDCSAHCQPTPIAACAATSDACCPAGCSAADDPDCSPTCGDGKVQPGETCDLAIGAGAPGACPVGCDDGDPCTTDLLLSAGTCAASCVHLAVTAPGAGDGCCPPGANFEVDPDCAPICGNGVVERPVETCDRAAGSGSCPSACPSLGSCTAVALRGSPATCTAACAASPIAACATGDGCCPVGCTAAEDADCPVVCGDGVREAGEKCDRGITAGMPGACPTTCDDGDACTVDIAAGTVGGCTRTCTHTLVTACLGGDGCCPAGCSPDDDSDCHTVCGDGLVGAGETCDPPGTCPTTCPDDGDPCTREELVGDPSHCDAACRHVPITACSGQQSDACCPTGCSSATDSDC